MEFLKKVAWAALVIIIVWGLVTYLKSNGAEAGRTAAEVGNTAIGGIHGAGNAVTAFFTNLNFGG